MIITSKIIFFILLKKNPILHRIKIIIIIAFILRASIITRIIYINTGTRNENDRLLLISNVSNMTQSVFEHGGERTCLSLFLPKIIYCIVIRITMKRL